MRVWAPTFPHDAYEHRNGFSPVCVRKCVSRCDRFMYVLPQPKCGHSCIRAFLRFLDFRCGGNGILITTKAQRSVSCVSVPLCEGVRFDVQPAQLTSKIEKRVCVFCDEKYQAFSGNMASKCTCTHSWLSRIGGEWGWDCTMGSVLRGGVPTPTAGTNTTPCAAPNARACATAMSSSIGWPAPICSLFL